MEFKWNVNLPVLYNFTRVTMATCSVVWFACKPVGDDHIHNSSGGSTLKIGDLSECTNLNFLFSTHSLWYHAEIYAVHVPQQYCMHWKMHRRGQIFMEKPQSYYNKVLVQIKYKYSTCVEHTDIGKVWRCLWLLWPLLKKTTCFFQAAADNHDTLVQLCTTRLQQYRATDVSSIQKTCRLDDFESTGLRVPAPRAYI